MIEFGKLIYNEAEKIYKKRRIAVIVLILLVLIPIFLYAQNQQIKKMPFDKHLMDFAIKLSFR